MYFKKVLAALILSLMLSSCNFCCFAEAQNATKQATVVSVKVDETQYQSANSLDVVNHPNNYLNKKIKMNATFDKFSTLGLDYKPAFRNSKEYISFLIRRNDVVDHVVPLSEMKLFLKREMAEKFIDLEAGDKIEIYGRVFSSALGDPWIEVEHLKITQKMPSKKKA
ncbi:MAG: hypothetical protein MRZ90_07880 [Candidatus Gastranaerophilales bacterium]|nr:hypothetical protein [Candidatus Gastranaerophilales bacterium]